MQDEPIKGKCGPNKKQKLEVRRWQENYTENAKIPRLIAMMYDHSP